MWVVDDEAMGLFKRTRAWLGEVGGFWTREAQKAISVVFDGAIPPSTAGMAAYRGPSLPCQPLPHFIVQPTKGKRVKDGLCYDSRYVVT